MTFFTLTHVYFLKDRRVTYLRKTFLLTFAISRQCKENRIHRWLSELQEIRPFSRDDLDVSGECFA